MVYFYKNKFKLIMKNIFPSHAYSTGLDISNLHPPPIQLLQKPILQGDNFHLLCKMIFTSGINVSQQ